MPLKSISAKLLLTKLFLTLDEVEVNMTNNFIDPRKSVIDEMYFLYLQSYYNESVKMSV